VATLCPKRRGPGAPLECYRAIGMRRSIPSISALAAFETVYRLRSISLAASELALTQSAISKKIQGLEAFFGQPLFVRQATGLKRTAAADLLWERLPPCLDELEGVMRDLVASRHGGGTLNLAVVPTFATKWLLPRLPKLYDVYPNLAVNLNVRLDSFEFVGSGMDAGIVFCTPKDEWRNCEHHLIVPEKLVPVCSADFIRRYGLPRSRDDLPKYPLLHQTSRLYAWPLWLQQHAIEVPDVMSGARFELFSMITEAAKAGLGIALLPEMFVAEDLARRQLKRLFPAELNTRGAYYLVYPSRKETVPGLVTFRNWILAEAG